MAGEDTTGFPSERPGSAEVDPQAALAALWRDLSLPEVLADPDRLNDIVAWAGWVRGRTSGALRIESDSVIDFARKALQLNEQRLDGREIERLARTAEGRAALLGSADPASLGEGMSTPKGLTRPPAHGRRLISYLVDFALMVAVAFAALFSIGFVGALVFPDISDETFDSLAVVATLAVFVSVPLLYGAFFESSSGQATPGKRLVGQFVTNAHGGRLSFGRAAGRNAVKVLELFFCWPILYGAVLVSDQRQGLHDKAADTLVLQKW